MVTQPMSTIRRDLVARQLRSEIERLRNVLFHVEGSGRVDCGYADESLKEIGAGLRQIRKVCMDN
jgi:hypothetical protein